MPGDFSKYQKFLEMLAVESGKLISRYYMNPECTVEIKSDQTPVTLADRGAEELIRTLIMSEYPEHGILGEEYGVFNPGSDFRWVIDPIDGTQSFVHNVPLFTTLIALTYQGQPVLGCIHQPLLNLLCIGNGTSTTLNGRPVKVRGTQSLKNASVMASSIQGIEKRASRKGFDILSTQLSKVFRTWGDGYGYLLLASGSVDVMIDAMMNPWDILPIIPIIRGAGGQITAWDGSDPVTADSSVASNGVLHEELLELLNSKV